MKPKLYIVWTDSIIEEIHKIRKEHAAKSNYDLRAIVRDYQKQQRQSERTVVSFIEKSEYLTSDIETAEK